MRHLPAPSLLVLLLLAGCANSPTPNYDMRFGEAVRQARLRQTLHPTAVASPDPAVGMDGNAAHDALLQYHNTFKAPPPVVNVINIGGSTGSR